jgi:hypothetical protein
MVRILKHIIKGYALWIWYYLWKPYRDKVNKEAKRKIEICEKCEFLDHHFRMCNLCGCLMDIKTKSAKKEDCYGGKW